MFRSEVFAVTAESQLASCLSSYHVQPVDESAKLVQPEAKRTGKSTKKRVIAFHVQRVVETVFETVDTSRVNDTLV